LLALSELNCQTFVKPTWLAPANIVFVAVVGVRQRRQVRNHANNMFSYAGLQAAIEFAEITPITTKLPLI